MSCVTQEERLSSVIDKIRSRVDVPDKEFDKAGRVYTLVVGLSVV